MKNTSLARVGLRITAAVLLATTALSPAYADINVLFSEGAPKDRFSFRNDTACDLTDLSLEIDLSSSSARLIFDTTGSGAGVEVFQPFERVNGQFALAGEVTDGEQQLTLQIEKFAAGETISFTIDVDDTLTASELGNIRVSSSEMQGSQVRLKASSGAVVSATFGADNRSSLKIDSCET